MSDRSEYLVVAHSPMGTEEWQGRTLMSVRCNRRSAADAIADWLNTKDDIHAQVFHDPPLMGQI